MPLVRDRAVAVADARRGSQRAQRRPIASHRAAHPAADAIRAVCPTRWGYLRHRQNPISERFQRPYAPADGKCAPVLLPPDAVDHINRERTNYPRSSSRDYR